MDIEIRDLRKGYADGHRRRMALDGVSLDVERGERVALIGPSGAGKSTLLRAVAGLVVADAGAVKVAGRLVQTGGRLAPGVRRARAEVGLVFQQFNLVGRLTLRENVEAGLIHRSPLWRSLSRCFRAADRRLAVEALEDVGLADRADQRADTLSGGQQQRAAIARAVVQRSRVLLGDEPVSSLDPPRARRVLDQMVAVSVARGVTCVVSLHQPELAAGRFPRTVAIAAGRVVYDGPTDAVTPAVLAGVYVAEPALAARGAAP